MTQYMVAIHFPDDFDAAGVNDPVMDREIDELNDEMVARGVRVFVGGMQPVTTAISVRKRPDGDLLVTDGPYLETKEHVGGFWVLECASRDEAVAWGRKAAIACRARAGSAAPEMTAQAWGIASIWHSSFPAEPSGVPSSK